MVFPYNGKLCSLERNEVLLHAATWMNLENTMQSERKPEVSERVIFIESESIVKGIEVRG
jgi:hypothetical protein